MKAKTLDFLNTININTLYNNNLITDYVYKKYKNTFIKNLELERDFWHDSYFINLNKIIKKAIIKYIKNIDKYNLQHIKSMINNLSYDELRNTADISKLSEYAEMLQMLGIKNIKLEEAGQILSEFKFYNRL